MAPTTKEREFTAAHEVGHALLLNHFDCMINSVSNISVPDWKAHPITYSELKSLESYDDMLCRAAGVAGVMFWRGQRIVQYIKCDCVRVKLSKSFACYYFSRKGYGHDRIKVEELHFTRYGRVLSEASFYLYASAAVDVIARKQELFAKCHGALMEHRYISKYNFQNLLDGRPFDAGENRLAKTMADYRDYFA